MAAVKPVITTAIPTLFWLDFPMVLFPILTDRTGSGKSWRPVTGSGCGITHISACIHDINEIPMAITMFPGSNFSMVLFPILTDLIIVSND